jgi:hypothetical protein
MSCHLEWAYPHYAEPQYSSLRHALDFITSLCQSSCREKCVKNFISHFELLWNLEQLIAMLWFSVHRCLSFLSVSSSVFLHNKPLLKSVRNLTLMTISSSVPSNCSVFWWMLQVRVQYHTAVNDERWVLNQGVNYLQLTFANYQNLSETSSVIFCKIIYQLLSMYWAN